MPEALTSRCRPRQSLEIMAIFFAMALKHTNFRVVHHRKVAESVASLLEFSFLALRYDITRERRTKYLRACKESNARPLLLSSRIPIIRVARWHHAFGPESSDAVVANGSPAVAAVKFFTVTRLADRDGGPLDVRLAQDAPACPNATPSKGG